jgi:hypothetical protein
MRKRLPVVIMLSWVAVLVLVAIFGAAPVRGQSTACAPHGVVLERLADLYGEARLSVALVANGAVLETFANLESGSWTITLTAPGGPTCLVAAGTDFQLTTTPAGEES